MKQTAMQQHIEWLKATLEICKEHAPTLVNCISLCISDAESRLEMERKQIMNAMDWIMNKYFEFHEQPTTSAREQYYNETFKSE